MFMTKERLVQDLTQIIIRLEKALEMISEGDDKTYRQAIALIDMCGDTLSSFPKWTYEHSRANHLLKDHEYDDLKKLFESVREDMLQEVCGILDKGFDVNSKNSAGWTALHLCAKKGSKEMTSLLISKGAKLDSTNKDHETPLDIAKKFKNIASCAVLLSASFNDLYLFLEGKND